MNPGFLQKQLKDNANDLQEFYKELKLWGDEMKRKEEALKNPDKKIGIPPGGNKKRKTGTKQKKSPSKELEEKPKGKVSTTDYSAWDKFDADAECERVDYNENEESDLTDECDEEKRDEAYVEKEKGNKFVKQQKWKEASECYSRAIDCFGFDPIFYANRALCWLKLEKMEQAEKDCNLALKLDKTYVKAYQRRAAAREALDRLEEAEADLESVLELECNNKESKTALEKLRKKLENRKKPEEPRPVSKFAASRGLKKSAPAPSASPSVTTPSTDQPKIIDTGHGEPQWSSDDSNDLILIKPINKAPHLRSKKPLKRIEIKETSMEIIPQKSQINKIDEAGDAIKDLVIERQPPKPLDSNIKNTPEPVKTIIPIKQENKIDSNKELEPVLTVPKNSVQFHNVWRHLKSSELKYKYLKLIDPKEIPDIFKESLETDAFTDIIVTLTELFIKNNDKVFDYLYYLTLVKRFSTFTMFMGANEKNCLWKLIDWIKVNEDKSKEDVDSLIKQYEL